MVYFSALHYASKAEKSAKLAEQYAMQATSFSGRIIQLGFDGTLEDGVLTFRHAPSGIDVPYDLLDDYEYELDLAYFSTESLPNDTKIVIKNGTDTINFVSALHRDSTTPVTVNEMKQVMRFNDATGYRWLFKSAFKVTPSGQKVFLLYPVIALGGGGSGRNIGDIFYTSRLDNELNGAVEANGDTYNVADFTGEKSVPALLTEGKLPFVSFEEYENIVATNGSCRAWGWDNGDTFRVPKLNDVYLMAGTAETAGEFINESLPNHYHVQAFGASETGNIGERFGVTNTGITSRYYDTGGEVARTYGANTSNVYGSDSYQDGAKVRPDSVRYRAMVHLSNEATDEALITATSVLSDVSDLKQKKADKDISVIDIPSTSGTVTLTDNTIYSGTMTGAMTFVLPTVTDTTKYHQIKAMLYLPVVTIDWGTTHYMSGEAPDISEAGQYMIYWDYIPALSGWAVGTMKVA